MKLKNNINNLSVCLLILSIPILTSCVAGGGKKKDDGRASSSPSGKVASNISIPEGAVDSGLAIKTFNQFNMSLSKLTGIDVSNPSVNGEYLAIRNSLPAGHDPSKFTPFHQVSVTRLAFAYCDSFIDNNSQFKNLDYDSQNASDITNLLVVKFVGNRTGQNANYFDGISNGLLKVMNNDGGVDEVGSPIGSLIPNETGRSLKVNLTKLTCTTLLASSEFSVL